MHVWQGGCGCRQDKCDNANGQLIAGLETLRWGSDGVRQCRLAGAVGRLVASTLAQLPDTVWLGLAWLSARQSDTLASARQRTVNGNASSSSSSSTVALATRRMRNSNEIEVFALLAALGCQK